MTILVLMDSSSGDSLDCPAGHRHMICRAICECQKSSKNVDRREPLLVAGSGPGQSH